MGKKKQIKYAIGYYVKTKNAKAYYVKTCKSLVCKNMQQFTNM